MGALSDAWKDLLPRETDPARASKGRSGETEAQPPERRDRQQGDYLPVIAVLVGVGLLAVAMLRPQAANLALPEEERAPSRIRSEDESFGYE